MPLPDSLLEQLLTHQSWMRALARSLVLEDHAADDLVQDATIIALTQPPREAGALKSWLRRVLRNLHANRVRSDSRRTAREQTVPQDEATTDDPLDVVAQWEIRKEVVDAVLTLAEPYRTTILLRYFEGLTRAEVAERMDVSTETVHTRQRRALEKLRGKLGKLDPERWERKRLALLFIAHGDGMYPRAETASTAATSGSTATATTLSGVLLMFTFKKSVLAVAAAALALVAISMMWPDGSDGPGRFQGPPPVPPIETAEGDVSQGTSTSSRTSPETDSPKTSAAEVAIDRVRDLHGVVVDAEGAPISRATVRTQTYPYLSLGSMDVDRMFEPRPHLATTTAEDGTFRLRLELDARVNVLASKEGFADAEYLQFQAGEHARIVLPAAVQLTIAVKSPIGTPVPDAKLLLFTNPRRGGRFVATRAVTDEHGTRVFAKLPGGLKLKVEVQSPEHGAPHMSTVVLPAEGDHTVEITLMAGRSVNGRVFDAVTGESVNNAEVGSSWMMRNRIKADSDGRFNLLHWSPAGHPHLHAVAPGFTGRSENVGSRTTVDFALHREVAIAARIVDTSGKPIEGAFVSVTGFPSEGGTPQYSAGLAQTDAAGRLRVGGLWFNVRHTLRVAHRGVTRSWMIPAAGEPGQTLDQGTLELISGRVVSGTVLNADGSPAARVDVGFMPVVRRGERDLRLPSRTDDLGRFQLTDVPAGRVRVDAKQGRELLASAFVEVAHDVDPPPLVLQPEAPSLFGVLVTTATGEPLPSALVNVMTQEGGRHSQAVNEHGLARFAIEGTVVSVSALLTDAEQRARYVSPGQVRPTADQTSIKLAFEAGASISGQVLDEDDRPVGKGFVQFDLPVQRGRLGFLGPDGRFLITVPAGSTVDLHFRPLPPKRGVHPPLWEGSALGVESPQSGVVLRVKRIPQDRSLSVRIVDPNDQPVFGMRIAVSDGNRIGRASEPTGEDGTVRFEKLPASELNVESRRALISRGFKWARARPQRVIPNGQTIVLRLRRALPIRGVVLRADGKPVPFATVSARTPKGERDLLATATTDAEGTFALLVAEDVRERCTVYAQAVISSTDRLVGSEENVSAGTSGLRIVVAPPPPEPEGENK